LEYSQSLHTLAELVDTLEVVTKNLNPSQKEAVLQTHGPLLILAGAGSGKTRVLTHRMAALIASGDAAPEEILCVTFTNKAAKEMESRIYQLLSQIGATIRQQLWISTFHSFCVRILRNHITLLEYKPHFSIFDPADQLSQIKKVMNQLNINDKIFPAKSFQAKISNAKMMAVNPEQIKKSPGRYHFDPKSVEVYAAYEVEMKKNNALDFDDLLLKTYELFQMYPDLLAQMQEKFRYIMVDEYQDTNHIQYLLVQKLAQAHRNLCVVGDEDQAIYSWRGADIRNILDFEKDFPEAKVVKLEENYRSTKNIVEAATQLIANNSQRKDKTLFTSNQAGDLIRVIEERSDYDEARFVVKTIQNQMTQGEGSYSDYAIFYRTNAQSRVLEEQLRTQSVPYKIVGGVRFFERMEIKDMISYMKICLNPADDMALKRIINVPTRGIGKTTVEQLEELAFQNKKTLYEIIPQVIDSKHFNSGTTGKLRRFFDLILDLQKDSKNFRLTDFYPVLLEKTGYAASLQAEETAESAARLENLEEFDNALAQFEQERGDEATLQAFLEEMALVSDQDSLKEEVNSVTLMTLHVSKGLEYPYVFIVGLEENLFPSRIDPTDLKSDDLEEERRLAYVGMTRARQKLWLTYAKTRKVWGQEQMNPPSRFLQEIPQNLVEFKSLAPRMPSFASRSQAFSNGSSWSSRPAYRQDDVQDFPDYDSDSQGSDTTGSPFSKGQRVKHPTFGVGTVFSVEGSGDQTKVGVLFSDQTIKKFVVKYARLEKI
jgi:DNA helicase-2/ATP-dependent DNA helicase PcrA